MTCWGKTGTTSFTAWSLVGTVCGGMPTPTRLAEDSEITTTAIRGRPQETIPMRPYANSVPTCSLVR